jgi:hypothetical protein
MEDDPRAISVSVNGYVSWQEALRKGASNPLCGASVCASAEARNWFRELSVSG